MGVCPRCDRLLPSPGFPFCPWCAAPLTRPEPGQRKTVTILFADLVESTKLGSDLDPEVLRLVLSSFWDMARDTVERHGGTVEKFIGDAVVGVFGIPVVHEDDAVRAVRAASDMLAGVRDLNVRLRSRVGVELAVRVGVNTGPVMVGDPAGEVSLMAGDAANVGARLEQAAAPGEVLLGEATYRLVRDVVDVEAVLLTVKGKALPVSAFRLRGERTAGGPIRRRRFSAPLVGRRPPLQLARAAYEAAVEDRVCALLTVVGAPGVGKSRLVEELLAKVRAEALVLEGRCLAYGEGITYFPLVQMLHQLADADPAPFSEQLAGIEHADEIAAGLDTLAGRSTATTTGEIAWAFRRLLESLARRGPVVVVVDDIQWAEPALLDLLDHLTDLSRGAPILLVCMARPEFLQTRPTWGAGRLHSLTTVLAPLSEEDSIELTSGLLGADADRGLISQITTVAEGIPLFLEEFVAMLADQGGLQLTADGTWSFVGDLGAVTVPPTVQALLAARLDRLPAGQRAVIDAAAVIGKTFYPDAVAFLLGRDAYVLEGVEALVRADLVRTVQSDLPGHDAYTFGHLLIRDAAYESLSKARRAHAHEAIARWLDQMTAGEVAPELVVSHLQRSAAYRAELGDPDPALADETAARLLACAGRARVLEDLTSATGLLDTAAALVPVESPIGIAVALARAETRKWAGDYAAATRWTDQAEQAAAQAGDRSGVWRARLLRCNVEMESDPSFDIEAAMSLTDEAIEALAALGDDTGVAQAYEIRCGQHGFVGRLHDTRADAWKGLMAAQRAGNLTLVSNLIWNLVMPFWGGGATLAQEEQLLAEVEETFGHEPLLAQQVAACQVWLLAHRGHLDQGIAYTRDRASLSIEQGNPSWAAALLNGLSWCQRWSDDLSAAVESLMTAARIREELGETAIRSIDLAEVAVLQARLGNETEAATALEQSRSLSQQKDLANQIVQTTAEALLCARRGEGARSEALFIDGLRLAGDADFPYLGADLWHGRSLARELLDDPAGALAAAREALAAAEREGFVPPIRLISARVADCEAMVSEGRGATA